MCAIRDWINFNIKKIVAEHLQEILCCLKEERKKGKAADRQSEGGGGMWRKTVTYIIGSFFVEIWSPEAIL